MDKETLSNYGWITIAILVLSVMIALSTPFGNYIKAAVWNTTTALVETTNKSMNIIENNNNTTNGEIENDGAGGTSGGDVDFGNNTEEGTPDIDFGDNTQTIDNSGLYDLDGNRVKTWNEWLESENATIQDGKLVFDNFSLTSEGKLIANEELTTLEANLTFSYCNLTEIDLSNTSITELPAYCFQYAEKLTTITLPNTIDFIEENAFKNCDNLTTIIYKGTRSEWGDKVIVGETGNETFFNANIIYAE